MRGPRSARRAVAATAAAVGDHQKPLLHQRTRSATTTTTTSPSPLSSSLESRCRGLYSSTFRLDVRTFGGTYREISMYFSDKNGSG